MKILYILFAILILEGAALAGWYPRSASYNTSGDIIGDNGIFAGDVSITGILSTGGNVSDGVFNEDIALAAGYDWYSKAGAGVVDLHNMTGYFYTPSGINILNGNVKIAGTKTFMVNGGAATFGSSITAASLVVNTTAKAEDLESTDDAYVKDDAIIDGGLRVDETITANKLVSNTTLEGTYLYLLNNAYLLHNFEAEGTARIGSTATANAVVSNTTITGTGIRGTSLSDSGNAVVGGTLGVAGAASMASLTVNSSGTAAIITADKLTVAGVIIPQAITIPVRLSSDSENGTVFIPISGNYQVIGIQEAHSVAATDLHTVTATLVKCSSTQAPATAGTVIMSNTINLKGTPETIQTGTLHINDGTCKVNTTERLGIRFNNPLTGLAGGCLSISVKRIA